MLDLTILSLESALDIADNPNASEEDLVNAYNTIHKYCINWNKLGKDNTKSFKKIGNVFIQHKDLVSFASKIVSKLHDILKSKPLEIEFSDGLISLVSLKSSEVKLMTNKLKRLSKDCVLAEIFNRLIKTGFEFVSLKIEKPFNSCELSRVDCGCLITFDDTEISVNILGHPNFPRRKCSLYFDDNSYTPLDTRIKKLDFFINELEDCCERLIKFLKEVQDSDSH